MSDPKGCSHHQHEKRKLCVTLFIGLFCLTVIILFGVFLTWLLLRPIKPAFVLQDATVYDFNLTANANAASITNAYINTDIQLTIAASNPNERAGIFYDHLHVYATYRGQQITLDTLLPDSYQGKKEVFVWSPFLNGGSVLVAPYIGEELSQDERSGMVMINIRVDGEIRWKVGSFISGRYRLYVHCPAYLSFGGEYSPKTILVGSTAKYQLGQSCHVDL